VLLPWRVVVVEKDEVLKTRMKKKRRRRRLSLICNVKEVELNGEENEKKKECSQIYRLRVYVITTSFL